VQTGVAGVTTRTVHPTQTTIYNATITDVNGCSFDPPFGVLVTVGGVSCIIAAILAKYPCAG
jgi:hypothetical protein